MKKTLLAVALASSLTSFGAVAADKAPEPDFSISGNFGLFSDYRFRGISQTQLAPAIQGGLDLSFKNGFYLGNWNSNVNADYLYLKGAGLEMDFYGGYRTEIAGIGIDIGNLYYYYPGASNISNVKYDTNEIYLGLSYGPVSFKTSYATTDAFAAANTDGSIYYDLTVSHSISDKVAVAAHAGFTDIANSTSSDYTDYKISLSYSLPQDFVLSLALYANTGDGADAYTTLKADYNNKDLGKNGAVISLTKTF